VDEPIQYQKIDFSFLKSDKNPDPKISEITKSGLSNLLQAQDAYSSKRLPSESFLN
jgi:hypothetical protein